MHKNSIDYSFNPKFYQTTQNYYFYYHTMIEITNKPNKVTFNMKTLNALLTF